MNAFLGRRSGVGLVFANMVGSGVLLSAGFMAQELTAPQILLSWVVGCVLALAGARAYAELAGISGQSGGEYRYLSDYLHPFAGYVAGWASLLIGFSATIAIDAFAVGAFLKRVAPETPVRLVGSAVIIALTAAHAARLNWSRIVQNGLVILKIGFVVALVVLGVVFGTNAWPTWEPAKPSAEFPTRAFILNQYWVAFAFSGWNAAIYAAGEFENPRRDVPFACLTGAAVVGLLYLALNWVFVANLTPESAAAVFAHEETRITLAHVVASDLFGEIGGTAVSLVVALIMTSAMSAMMLIGPRVYAAMADDGFLPRIFASVDGAPPRGAVILQGSIALVMLHVWTIVEVLQSSAAVLMLSSGLTAASLFALRRREKVRPIALAAAAVYVATTTVFLIVGSYDSTAVVLTLLGLIGISIVGWYVRKLA